MTETELKAYISTFLADNTHNLITESIMRQALNNVYDTLRFPMQYVFKAFVDMKVAGLHTLGVVQAGRGYFIPTDCWFVAENVSGLGMYGATINIGTVSTNYYNFVSGQNLPNSSFGPKQFHQIPLRAQGSSRLIADEGSTIKVNVTGASNATNYGGNVFVAGYFVY